MKIRYINPTSCFFFQKCNQLPGPLVKHYPKKIKNTPSNKINFPLSLPQITMSTVGTLVFCSDCGNLLDSIAGSDRIECEMCGAVTKGSLLYMLCAEFEKRY